MSDDTLSSQIEGLALHIHESSKITVLTGAGVSAASGVPTFRGPGGLWRNHRPESLATAEAFARDPKLVWEWYNWRREVLATRSPNRAHIVLAEWSRRYPGLRLITQNVDGLHERAGAINVLRFHGSIWELRCWERCRSSPAAGWLDETVPLGELPPRCPYCGGIVRPGVVWFGEAIDPEVIRQSVAALDCDVFLTIGTSALVYPAASLVVEARRRGAVTAKVNIEATPVSGALDMAIQGPAEEVLDHIERRILGWQGESRVD